MEDFFRHFWWLMFPLMAFVFAGFGMAMHAGMQRDRMRLLRTYAEKGQTPPPELLEQATNPYGYDAGYGTGPGYYGRGDRYARRMWRRERRWAMYGPWWGLRRSFFFLAVFVAIAVTLGARNDWDNPFFVIVAIIAGGAFLSSMLSVAFMAFERRGPDGQRTDNQA